MSVFKQRARVRKARSGMAMARGEVGESASALLARAHKYPLTTLGVATGTGFVLGSLNVHPLRLPGLTSLLGGGIAGAITHGSQWLAELAALGLLPGHASDVDAGASPDRESERP